MTIYDAAPAIFAIVLSTIGWTVCKIDHDRAVAARDARRAARHIAAG